MTNSNFFKTGFQPANPAGKLNFPALPFANGATGDIDSKISNTQNEFENILMSIQTTEGEINKLNGDSTNVKSNLDTCKGNIDKNTEALEGANTEVEQAQSAMSDAMDALNEAIASDGKDDNAKNNTSAARNAYDSAKAKYEEAVQRQKELQEEATRLKEESSRLQSEYDRVMDEIANLENEINQDNDDKTQKQQELDELKRMKEQLESSKREFDKTNERQNNATSKAQGQQDIANHFMESGELPVLVRKVGDEDKPFEENTLSLMYKKVGSNRLTAAAQKYLGYQEVTPEEYAALSDEEKKNTQMALIQKYGTADHQWCAHSASTIIEDAGIDMGGHKMAVSEYVQQAKENGTYRGINTKTITQDNFETERKNRSKQIKNQLGKMNSGDLIIWKTDYAAKLEGGKVNIRNSSHIGIIEEVTPDGKVVVLEGNANEFNTNRAERTIVSNKKQGKIGNQDEGDYLEMNNRDGYIRKVYDVEDLANFGYSGYIDMQKKLK